MADMQPAHKRRPRGFTLTELLVVIAIIGLLSSVVIASLNKARIKARDAQRAANMQTIALALGRYYLEYGCLPRTTTTTCGPAAGTYSEGNGGGWDYSSQGGFMDFLKTAGYVPSVPVDPINNMTGDGSPVRTYAFRYYCYTTPSSHPGVHLGYWSELTNTEITVIPQPGVYPWADPTFNCK